LQVIISEEFGMANQKATGIQRIINATRFSIAGFKAVWLHEAAFRQELGLLVIAVPAAFWLSQDRIEQVLLIASVLLVLLVELINSAIEAVVDRIGMEKHPLSGRAKDIASAAVMLALIMAVITWVMILI